ncbi:hypothetical protein F511_25022 [Dorcoceras hygrometricum]|uniref:Uncharacterized protein n=1 Tax=Dorcoceras hygrometricum TaxID=472368 RepID=A0A2Z7BCZ9_9LAMI|nr:hypothetical protein F511_25022 [Dorcoceras hygrometricum]
MVNTPKRQSHGFAIQISVLVQNVVKENLGELVKLHPQKVLTSKSVQTYIKKNLDVKSTGETSTKQEDTARNNEGSETQIAQTVGQETQDVKKKSATAEAETKKKNLEKKIVPSQTVDAGSKNAPADSSSQQLDLDSCPRGGQNKRGGTKRKQVVESSDSESTISLSLQILQQKRGHKGLRHNRSLLVTRVIPSLVRHQNNSLEINWVTHFQPKINPAVKGKEVLVPCNKPTPVEEHYQLVLNSTRDDVSARMDVFDEWVHFQKSETEQVSEFFERRLLIMYKLYELEVQKSIEEHRANFKPTEPSVNYYYMCIQFLSNELREISGIHRAQRVLAGLPIEAPEASIAGDAVGSNTFQLTWSSIAQ